MKNPVFTCAHRGASATHPENTLPAFARAIELGCGMIEFDVRATQDGALVLLHDPTVDRTTNGSGNIWDVSYATVQQLDASAGHEGFSGTPMPTLKEALDFFPQSIALNIHVYPGPRDGKAIVAEVCDEIGSRKLYEQAFIAGTDDVMDLVIARDPQVRRCLLGSQNRPETYAQLASQMGCSNLQPLNSITTKALSDQAHDLDLIVHPFYADDEAEMRRLIACGVDGILTNHPERMIRLLDTLG